MPRPACRSTRPVPLEQLHQLADHLLSARLDGGEGAALVRVGSGPGAGDLDLGLLPLPEGVHPVDVLLGEALPTRWWAGGVVASASARRDDGADPPEPVALAVLVTRDGRCIHRIEAPSTLVAPGAEPPTGRVVDLLLRTVGRPTPPPEVSPSGWWDAVWLDRVAVRLLAGDALRGFGDLAALHPLLTGDATVEAVASRHRGADDAVAGWRAVHRLGSLRGAPETGADAAARAAIAEHLGPDEVGWMDEGCLSRWLVSELPPLGDLVGLADALLPTRLAVDLRRALGLSSAPGDDRPDQGR